MQRHFPGQGRMLLPTVTRLYFSITRTATQDLPAKSEDFFLTISIKIQTRRSRPALACCGDQLAMPYSGADTAPVNAHCMSRPHENGFPHSQKSGRLHPHQTGPETRCCLPRALPSSCCSPPSLKIGKNRYKNTTARCRDDGEMACVFGMLRPVPPLYSRTVCFHRLQPIEPPWVT